MSQIKEASGGQQVDHDFAFEGKGSCRVVQNAGVWNPGVVAKFERFIGGSAAALPAWLKATKTGTSTNNTVAYANTHYTLTHSSDSEAQTMRLDGGDGVAFDLYQKGLMFRAVVAIDLDGAAFSADQRVVIGVASAYNATLNSVATNAWFRIEGADLSILTESDDGSTDTDDIDTGIDIADAVYRTYEIDFSDLSAVAFSVDGKVYARHDMSAITSSTLVQPMICIQRDGGAEEEKVLIKALGMYCSDE